MLSVFSDRLKSQPGRLPNTAIVEALKAGFRYARNQTLVNIMRLSLHGVKGYGHSNKVIPDKLAHNGTEPEFIETDWLYSQTVERTQTMTDFPA